MTLRLSILMGLALTLPFLVGCATAPPTEGGRSALESDAAAAKERFLQTDPTLGKFLNQSAGYALFPSVVKGGAGLGGAYGRGVLYQGSKVVGYCDLSQGSIGFQLGGEEYSELIVFHDAEALVPFKAGEFTFAAQASAVAAKAGAAASADYKNGVAVFTKTVTGLMFEAAIGGQNFSYLPK